MSGRFLINSSPINLILKLPIGTRFLSIILFFNSILIQFIKFNFKNESNLKSIFRGINNLNDTITLPWFLLVPGNLIWYPWTILTAGLCEVGLIELVFSLLTLSLCGRYLERVYGTTEFIKFSLSIITISNLLSVMVNVIEHYALRDSGFYLYGTSYRGMMALQAGFLVAFTQLIPEHQVQLFGVIRVRVKNLPMIYVTFSNVMCIIGYQSPFILIQMGWLSSWYYLRFIRWNENGEFRGDRSETFAFAIWFPTFIQPLVRKLSDICFTLAVKCKIVKQWTPMDVESGGYASVPGGTRAEAERRRAMALKALDQRLASNKSTTPSNHVNSPPDPSNSLGVTSPISRITTTPAPIQSPLSNVNKSLAPVSSAGTSSEETRVPTQKLENN